MSIERSTRVRQTRPNGLEILLEPSSLQAFGISADLSLRVRSAFWVKERDRTGVYFVHNNTYPHSTGYLAANRMRLNPVAVQTYGRGQSSGKFRLVFGVISSRLCRLCDRVVMPGRV